MSSQPWSITCAAASRPMHGAARWLSLGGGDVEAIIAEERGAARHGHALPRQENQPPARPPAKAGTAAGTAWINPVGKLAGFVWFFMIGCFKDLTGSSAAGMMMIAGILAVGALCALAVPAKIVNR